MSKQKKEDIKSLASHEPVFRLKIMGEDRVLCKYIGTVESRDKLYDEPIELPHQGGVIKFPNEGNYEILGRACACNIPGGHLLKNKKIPIYYISMIYASQFVTGALFNYFLYFTIDQQTSAKLLLPKNYVNRSMSGKFTLELMDSEGFLSFFLKKKRSSIEDDIIESFLEKIELASDDEKIKINSEIQTEVEKKLDKYRQMFEPIQMEGTLNNKKIFTQMENFYRSDDFKELISSCLEFTQIQRLEKMGGNTLKKVPKRVLKLKECLDDPNKINEYVNNLPSDNDSEESYDDADVIDNE